MKRLFRLRQDQKGVSAVEFALIAPVLFAFIIAIGELGLLFYANAGLNNALAEGARYASIYPKPANELITRRITDRRFGLVASRIVGPTYVEGTTSNGVPYTEITLGYSVPLDFIFFSVGPITLRETRRVYTQSAP